MIQDFNKAIELKPNDTDSYYIRGITYDNLGQYELAIQDFDKANELNPNLVNFYLRDAYRQLEYDEKDQSDFEIF